MQRSLLTLHLNPSAAFDPTGDPLRKFPLVFPSSLDSSARLPPTLQPTSSRPLHSHCKTGWGLPLPFTYIPSQGNFIQLRSLENHLHADFLICISCPDLFSALRTHMQVPVLTALFKRARLLIEDFYNHLSFRQSLHVHEGHCHSSLVYLFLHSSHPIHHETLSLLSQNMSRSHPFLSVVTVTNPASLFLYGM